MCLLVLALTPAPAAALEELLLGVTLNEVDKGAYFAYRTADDDLLFSEQDLRAMGFRALAGAPTDVGGVPHRSLRSVDGVGFVFDPATVSARITAAPALLARSVIDFLAPAAAEVAYPVSRSAFLNLGVDYRDGDGYDEPLVQAASELGVRWGDYLFVGDGLHRSGGEDAGFVRLMSRASWEDRERRLRLTLGDFAVPARDLLSTPDLGGLSFSKVYRMDPYRLRHPTYGLAGETATPARVQVYLDGVLVRDEKVDPGEFEITNLDAHGGDRRVEVVLRDVFGRETRVDRRYYFTDGVLGRGLHEFSYNLGWAREDFGVESNDYGDLAASAFHRYGVSDFLTLGFAGQAGDQVASAGPTLSLVAGHFGIVSLALAAGRMDGERGYAWSAGYDYESSHLSARAAVQRSSAAYRTLQDEDASERPRSALQAEVSYGTSSLGRGTLFWSRRDADGDDDQTRYGVDYNISLFGTVSLHATAARVEEKAGTRTELFAGASYYLDDRRTVSAEYGRQGGRDQALLEFAEDRTNEEGLAWKGTLQRQADVLTLRPWAEYRGRHGIVAGELALREDGDERFQGAWDVSAAAALYAGGGTVGMGRPVTDSFAVVRVGREPGLPGVRVYHGGEESGATGKDGTLLLPEVGSYVRSQISIEPKDIPLGYSIADLMRVISPAERSGSLVVFDVARYQAMTGRLVVTAAGARRPLEFVELVVRAGERTWSVPSGKDGEFFLENAGAGRIVLSFSDRGEERSCTVELPASEEVIVDLGEVPCEIAP